jgi:hypothetical protein
MSNITTVNNLVCSGNQTISGNIISNGNLQTTNITSTNINNMTFYVLSTCILLFLVFSTYVHCTLIYVHCTLTYVHCTLYTALPSTRSTGRLTTHSIITAAIYTLLTLFRDKGVNTI